MADKQISISTQLKGDGLQRLNDQLELAHKTSEAVSKEMQKWGASYSGVGGSNGASGMAPQHSGRRRGQQSIGQQYNLETPDGLIQWDENVLQVATPLLQAINNNKGVTLPTTTAARQQQDRVVNKLVNAIGIHYNSPSGAKKAQSFAARTVQHFSSNLHGSGGGVGSSLMSGLKGAVGGSLIDMALGGGAAGGAAGGVGAGLLGMAGGPLGMIAAVGLQQVFKWMGGQVSNGLQAYSNSASSFSEFGHALDTLGRTVKSASTAVESFRYNTVKAGATVGMNAQQSTQVAGTLMQAYGGSLGIKGLTALTQQAGTLALHSGLSYSEGAQIDALAASSGITNGVGSSMSNLQFNQMLANATARAKMQGRQSSFYTGLMGVYNGLQSQSPILSNVAVTAGQYTALNRSGIQGLQGQNGANLMNQMNASLSGQGLGQLMGMAAIFQGSHGKISNPWQMQSILEQGTAARVGNGTLGGSIINMAKQFGGGNKYTEAGIISSALGISINQAMALMQTNFANARGIGTNGRFYQPNTITDVNSIGKNELAAHLSKLGNVGATIKSWAARGANVPTGSTLAGAHGTYYSTVPNVGNATPSGPGGIRTHLGNQSTGPLSVTDQNVYYWLTAHGLSPSAAAGVLGNLQQESGVNPNKTGGGIAQWIGSRQTALQAYAKKTGKSANGLYTQLGFLMQELKSGRYGNVSSMNKMSASRAAQYFEANFEKAGIPDMNNRMNYANEFYDQFSSSKSNVVKLDSESVNQIVNGIGHQIVMHMMASNSGPSR